MKKLSIRKISNAKAKKEIEQFFIKKLSKGVTKLDVISVSDPLKIPENQVEKVFNEFIKEGRVKSI